MNHTLQKAIIEWIFENLDEFQIVNRCKDEFRLYIYDDKGEYLIGGAQVANFINKAIDLIRGKE